MKREVFASNVGELLESIDSQAQFRRIWQVGLTRRPFNRVTMSLEENVGTFVASLVILNNGNLDLIASEK